MSKYPQEYAAQCIFAYPSVILIFESLAPRLPEIYTFSTLGFNVSINGPK